MTAQHIRQSRRALGMTLDELARRTGVTKSFLCLLESGKRRPSMDTVEVLRTVFAEVTPGGYHRALMDVVPPRNTRANRHIRECAQRGAAMAVAHGDSISDLLVNVFHHCDAVGVDWHAELGRACAAYAESGGQ